ncbi:integrator complex subunit 8-like isoform X5 [Dendronephthya gigantea]|uniref:integrator complex subunit 8-like isoform X5 n=1 Tax=Dendronephthya gigantea TaxID=151771 RepID=UPI0010698654|nr:integrator complex subunit 8-like isoform X5 [Dendronephthya gigantea]
MESKKPLIWFEFLFDKTGTLLTTHLSTPNAAPSAEQLIHQFLEKSGCISPWTKNQSAPKTNQNGHEVSETNSKRKEPLLLLAFHVASHLEWNLGCLESGLQLYVQYVLLKELVKMYYKETEEIKPAPELNKVEKEAIFPLLLYYRWIVRSIVDQSSSKLTENKTNESPTGEAKCEKSEIEKLVDKIESEEAIAIEVLQQATSWKDDLVLPKLPLLKTLTETGLDNSEKDEKDEKEEGDDKELPPSDEAMDTSHPKTVSSQSIVGQICFDLGTLYFYKGNIEKAKGLFEICSGVQCGNDSFYTVDKKKLSGYYTACCSLLHCPVREDLVSSQSLMSQMEQSKYDGYKNLVFLLIQDNAKQQVPYTFKRYLEADVVRYIQQNFRADKTLPWKVCCCNTTGNLLAGRCVDPEFWKMLENSTGEQFKCFIELFVESVALLSEKQKSENNGLILSQLESSIASLLVGQFAQERYDILLRSNIGRYLDMNMMKKALKNQEEDLKNGNCKFSPISIQPHQDTRVDNQVQVSQLEHDLQVTSCPSQIPVLLMRLHSRDSDPHKNHAKGYESALYGAYIKDVKDDIQQDLLHVLFSKASLCAQRKDFVGAKSFLDFGFQTIQDQRKRYGNTSTFDKLSNFLSQEILVTNILIAEENREKLSPDILRRIMSNLTIGASDYAPKSHAIETMVVYLLNVQEWSFLSDLDIRCAKEAMDYKELARSIAGVCTSLTKPLVWRKTAKNMWDAVLKIFTSTVQHKRMLADGTLIDIKREPEHLPHFVKFIKKVKDETCLSLIMSCLERMRSLESPTDKDEKEQKNVMMHSHLWPTSIPSSSSIEFPQIRQALLEVIDHSVAVHPFNPTFLKTQGDTFYEKENHLKALRCYLQAGAASSDFFALPVPKAIWDNSIYRKMIGCCTFFNAHTQVALLCQFLEPLDYSLAFNAMKQTTRNDASEFYYNCIWDVTLLEFVIHIHSKQGENDKKQIAVQAISQSELNSCNPPEILQNAKRKRNTSFLQILAKQYL